MSNPPPIVPPPSAPPPAPPPVVPPPLNYSRPEHLPPGNNRWWKVMLRALAGMAAGVGSGFAGWGLVAATDYRLAPLFFLPFLVLLGVSIFMAIRFRRFGYVTGILLAPFIIGAGLIILLFIICGGLGHGFTT